MTKTIQTREQHYKEVIDWNKANPDDKLPVPEIIRAGDVAHTDAMGGKVLVRDSDVNATDVRDYDPDTGEASPWRKANA